MGKRHGVLPMQQSTHHGLRTGIRERGGRIEGVVEGEVPKREQARRLCRTIHIRRWLRAIYHRLLRQYVQFVEVKQVK